MKTLLFVDDEPRVLLGLQRQLRIMRAEWNMNFVAGGPQALAFMAAQPVDIIVSDMMMPGMDGSQLLTEVVKRHPQTVRIILSGHSAQEAVLRLVGPAHQYLTKPCNPDELRKAITHALALRDLLGSDRLKRLTTRIKHLPTLPSSQNEFTEELRQASPSLERIGEIISRDVGLTAKILQLVNSAFFGLGQPINNPMEAVIFLGLNTIHSLALAEGIFSRYDPKTCRAFSLEVLTRHSWLTGVLARCVAQLEQREVKSLEECFLAGLLHDVGQLILAADLPDEYVQVITKSRAEQRPVWQVEQEIFGSTHADVGAYLLTLWGLADPITEAVALHHQPFRCAVPEFSPTVAVHVANVFAHELAGTDLTGPRPQLDIAYLTTLGLAGRIDAWRESCRDSIKL